MPHKPIITCTAAVALSLFAGVAVAAPEAAAPQQDAAAGVVNACHAAPKGIAPQGAHWYYRTDRATKKKCWYLADEVTKTKTASPKKPSASAEAASSAPETRPSSTADGGSPNTTGRADRSVADARAEVFADKASIKAQPSAEEKNLAETVWPPISEQSKTAATPHQPPALDGTDAFASRWPDQVSTAAASDAQALLARKQAQNQEATAKPQPLPSTVGFASGAVAPEEQTSESSVSTVGLMLSILAGILALTAIIGPAILRYVRPRKVVAPRPRRAIWDNVDSNNPPEPWDAEQPTRNDNLPRELRDAEVRDLNAPQDELEKLLQRAKRSAA